MKQFPFYFLCVFLLACSSVKKHDKDYDFAYGDDLYDYPEDTSEYRDWNLRPVYHGSRTVLTKLVHTKIEVSFDWNKSWMYGKTSITACPYFHPTDSLILDAKGMEIRTVKLNAKELNFRYAGDRLGIKLDKQYNRNEKYTVVIDYIAKPDERKTSGSEAITEDKGLYFINPKGTDPNKMPQIWTQGETESNSVWFPTVDSPNMKSTQETIITVDDKYVTLSNGKLVKSVKNADGTRTDYWKQDLPHSVYLFMMGVGEFKVVKDEYTRKDGTKMQVNYYVEPQWERYARSIFGETPEMIRFFSELLKVEYPWDKYDQIVVRDYVSGAMENTSASVFGEFVYKTDRELMDGNSESIIAHELFHHWFGNLVTAESWSNLTLNESFANYSQYLWDEYRHGKDEADKNALDEEDGYITSALSKGEHNLVWFEYKNREDIFDAHSYNKGGRILHMLRNYLGDEAFFEGLTNYLTTNAYKTAEFHQLRIAFEEVCGEDLNWFFDQWYLGKGMPDLSIEYSLSDDGATLEMMVDQDQTSDYPLYKLPVAVAIYDGRGKTVYPVVVDKRTETFRFPVEGTVKTMVFDDKEILLARVTENGKTTEQYRQQYYLSKEFKTRLKALSHGIDVVDMEADASGYTKLLLDAVEDPYWYIREQAVQEASEVPQNAYSEELKARIKRLVTEDKKPQVRSASVAYLGSVLSEKEYLDLLDKVLESDSSYNVIVECLSELGSNNNEKALKYAAKYENVRIDDMQLVVTMIYTRSAKEEHYPFFEKLINENRLKSYYQIYGVNLLIAYSLQQKPEMQLKIIDLLETAANKASKEAAPHIPQYVDTYIEYIDGFIEVEAENISAFKKNRQPALEMKAEKNKEKLEEVKAKLSILRTKLQVTE